MEDHFTLCLWFDNQAEEAAVFYTSVFKNSKIQSISRYGKEGFGIHGQKEGTAMTVAFTINGQSFTALNELMSYPARSGRVTEAFLKMKKFDIEKLKNA